jgi:hypothetical protein
MAERSVTLESGPWRGVRYSPEPNTGAAKDLLYSATNLYIPDPEVGSGLYARPGFLKPTTYATSGQGQGVVSWVALDGSIYNFMFIAGVVLRWNTNLSSAPTVVTPTNVVIATTGFVYAIVSDDELIVNDGVNKPWRGTNLGSTPITATVIEQQTPTTVLSRGSTDTALANTAFTFTYRAGGSLGTQATQAANATGTALGALGQIAANTWGVVLVELSSTPAFVFTAAFNAGAGYASEALAIAALPARTATRHYVGYITVQADAGAVWIAGTDALAGGATGNQAQTTNYYAGEGAAWSAFGMPTAYSGSLFFICQQLAAVYARTTITWSEPGQNDVGYQQTDYDNAWTLLQTGSSPLYVLVGTNDALYYARQFSWGALSGAPGVNFRGSASHDLVSGNVGCTTPRSAHLFLNILYFMDAVGRPYRFVLGGAPERIWTQARVVYDAVASNVASATASMGWAVLEPNLNLYIVTRVRGGAFTDYATAFDVYDAATGIYMGQWSVGEVSGFRIGGIVRDASGTPAFAFVERNDGLVTANIWYLTRPFSAVWDDNGSGASPAFQPQWMAYSGSQTITATEIRVLMDAAGSQPSPVIRFYSTGAALSSSVSRSVSSANVVDTCARVVLPLDATKSRGIQPAISVSGTQTTQWKVWGLEVDVVPGSRATAEDI